MYRVLRANPMRFWNGGTMSFSSDCKEELCRVPVDKACCRLAELGALYMTLGALSLLGRGQLSVQFTVESPAIARRIFVLLQKEAQIVAQLHYVTHARFGGVRKCVLTVGPKQAPALLGRLHMMDADADGTASLRATTPRVKLNRDCCRRAFLRGAAGLRHHIQPRARLPSGADRP